MCAIIHPFILILLITLNVESARILSVFPTPAYSHQAVFQAFIKELAERGHEVVNITPNPLKEKHPNIREIDVSFIYDLKEIRKPLLKRGVINDIEIMTNKLIEYFTYIIAEELNHPEVKQLLEDKAQHFDLIIVEALLSYHMIVSHIFKAPIIAISSLYGTATSFQLIGAVARHPTLYPNNLRMKFRDFSYFDLLYEIYTDYKLYVDSQKIMDKENQLLKKNFGHDAPSVAELQKNVQMLLLNGNAIFADNRPVPPSVIFLGGIHMQPVKEIPKDLKTYLDNSKHGVVYVSLGTNVDPSLMDEEFLNAFIDAFKALPFNILWKANDDILKSIPENVKVQKWFPQRDLLMHPNIKVFVTQGGIHSTVEAIDAGVPLVGIPILGDQWFNVNKYVQFEIGVAIDSFTMNANDLIEAVNTVAGNSSYKENIIRLRNVLNDEPMKPMDRGMWWVEYILRHGGKHLQSPAAFITWTEYLMLDIFVPLLLALGAISIVIFLVLYKILRIFFQNKKFVCKKFKLN